MKKKRKMVGVYYMTREIARGVAKVNAKNAGIQRPCKRTNKQGKKHESWFSHNWREWAFRYTPKQKRRSA